jgi:acetyl-CoA carboxylase biotin carboxyl carrier protein
MDYKEITDLIRLVGKSNIADLTIEQGDFRIRLKTLDALQVQSAQVVHGPAVQHAVTTAPAAPALQPAPAPPPAPAAAVARPAEATPAAESAADESSYVTVRSPMVGTLYRRPSPDKDVYVKVGDTVSVGTVLCVIEAMKLFNEIECEVSGTVVRILAEDASPVEYDQPLFLIDPKG